MEYIGEDLSNMIGGYAPKEYFNFVIDNNNNFHMGYKYNYKKMYKLLFNEQNIHNVYLYPVVYENKWCNAIYNRLNNNNNKIVGGHNHTIALLKDGTIVSCGANEYGQLGTCDNTYRGIFTKINYVMNVVQISCGDAHSFILLENGTVMCCGKNVYGQLGLCDNVNRNKFTIIDYIKDINKISCGSDFTYLLLKDGSLMSCGYNYYGQLGLNDKVYRNKFNKVVTSNNSNMIIDILCGYNHVIILLNNKTAMICGINVNHQLCALTYIETNIFVKININADINNIYCGDVSTILLLNNNILKYYGIVCSNGIYKKFECDEYHVDNITKISCSYRHIYVLLENNTIMYVDRYNYNEHCSLEHIMKFTKVQDMINVDNIYCNPSSITIFIELKDGTIKGRGDNYNYQLGLNHTKTTNTFTTIKIPDII